MPNALVQQGAGGGELQERYPERHRLRDGLSRHLEILDEMFGPGTSNLPVVMCVLNSLATVRPMEGVSFVDDSAMRRIFDSPTFNLIASGPGASGRHDTLPGRRLWSASAPSADDFERMISRAPQAELAHHQIGVVEVETDLGGGTAVSRRCTWRRTYEASAMTEGEAPLVPRGVPGYLEVFVESLADRGWPPCRTKCGSPSDGPSACVVIDQSYFVSSAAAQAAR